MEKQTLVISAYPCCGKSYAVEHYQDKYTMLDSDSSQFSWSYVSVDENGNAIRGVRKIRNPEFPGNYIQHVKEILGKVDIIFVSSHLVVREALEEADIPYVSVYPEASLLNEWVGRMYRRGSSSDFIDFQIEHWDEFMKNVRSEPHGLILLRLGSNQYLDERFLFETQEIVNDLELAKNFTYPG